MAMCLYQICPVIDKDGVAGPKASGKLTSNSMDNAPAGDAGQEE